ncbi:MAG: TetR family transcriptional regulator [Pseudomonadota bacterium]
MADTTQKPSRRKRDAAGTRAAILQAALEEFSEMGHHGARVDRIAERAGVSKPMIYDYFGDKDAIYAAALREAYVQIRAGEKDLSLDLDDPEGAVRLLLQFTMDHFRENPWFIRMLNTENLLGAKTIGQIEDISELQSVLLDRLRLILRRGAEDGIFRSNVDPVRFYVLMASMCYFPVSNMHTLRTVFDAPIDEQWLSVQAEMAADALIKYLKADDIAS